MDDARSLNIRLDDSVDFRGFVSLTMRDYKEIVTELSRCSGREKKIFRPVPDVFAERSASDKTSGESMLKNIALP
jgi:hypothetical protein